MLVSGLKISLLNDNISEIVMTSTFIRIQLVYYSDSTIGFMYHEVIIVLSNK